MGHPELWWGEECGRLLSQTMLDLWKKGSDGGGGVRTLGILRLRSG